MRVTITTTIETVPDEHMTIEEASVRISAPGMADATARARGMGETGGTVLKAQQDALATFKGINGIMEDEISRVNPWAREVPGDYAPGSPLMGKAAR